jgi:Fe-S cluster biogenesis protein NfuA
MFFLYIDHQERGSFPVITKEQVESVLGRIRPFLHADGGDIEVVAVNGRSADVRLTGMCAGCSSALMTLHMGVETALREEIPQFEMLRLV